MAYEVESVQPALEDRVVDVLLFERLALRVDERRPRRRVHVHELRQMPEVELQEVLGGPRGNRIRRDDATLELRLELPLPRRGCSRLPVVQEEVVVLPDLRDADMRVLLQGEEEMGGFRVHNELSFHG